MTDVKDLINFFEDKINDKERNRDDFVSKEPDCPLLVSFLGKESIDSFKEIANRLFEMWPAFRDEIFFLGIEKDKENLAYYDLHLKNRNAEKVSISFEEMTDKISLLFGSQSHFANKRVLQMYYVMNTSGFKGGEELEDWIKVVHDMQGMLADDSLNIMDMLIVLLDESIGARKQAVASSVKNILYKNKEELGLSVLLLSNRRSDSAILESMDLCAGVIADTIILSDNREKQIADALFNKGIFTAAYTHEEKPVSKIGQIIIKDLISRMTSKKYADEVSDLLENSQISEKLGFSKQNTFTLIDDYVDRSVLKMLPSAEQLELFPRWECVDYSGLGELNEYDFNEMSMGSWISFINQTLKDVIDWVHKNPLAQQDWKREYAKTISTAFSVNELIWLADHLDELNRFFSEHPKLDEANGMRVLDAAAYRLKRLLSQDENIRNIFLETIKECGSKASEFLKGMNELRESGLKVHAVNDSNLAKFYIRRVQNFFDRNKENIDKSDDIKDMETMEKFLYDLTEDITESDPIFLEPFEEELEKRLEEEALPQNAREYIRRKLTGDNVPVYYQTQFSLEDPIASCILVKVGTKLDEDLKSHLPEITYYYDAGNGNYAEAINYYKVSDNNLIAGED